MSFFGGNTPEENKTGSTASTFNVKKTGKEIDGVVKSLLQAANDKDSGVKLAISIALKDIGLTETDLVVTTVMAFVTRTKQVSEA
jgi:hypothetical protein